MLWFRNNKHYLVNTLLGCQPAQEATLQETRGRRVHGVCPRRLCFIAVFPCSNAVSSAAAQAKVWDKVWPNSKVATKLRLYFNLMYVFLSFISSVSIYSSFSLRVSLCGRGKSQKKPEHFCRLLWNANKATTPTIQTQKQDGPLYRVTLFFPPFFFYDLLSVSGLRIWHCLGNPRCLFFYCHLPVSTDAGRKRNERSSPHEWL